MCCCYETTLGIPVHQMKDGTPSSRGDPAWPTRPMHCSASGSRTRPATFPSLSPFSNNSLEPAGFYWTFQPKKLKSYVATNISLSPSLPLSLSLPPSLFLSLNPSTHPQSSMAVDLCGIACSKPIVVQSSNTANTNARFSPIQFP